MKKLLLMLTLLLAVAGASFAQRTLTGTISDSKGESLIGASVIVKGTTIGIVTDLDGKFSLNVPATATALIVSFAGYESKELAIGADNIFTVQLPESILGEVIVTGQQSGGVDRRHSAVDVQSISSKNLPNVATSSLDQMLVGQVAGAQIASVNGTPGAKADILLRGINSFNAGVDPMYLVDGVQLGTDFNRIDPMAVERLEVAPGPASSTLYGAQGANGVVQSFIRKGKEGFHVDFSTSYTVSDYMNIGNLRKADLHGFNTDASNNIVDSKGNPITVDPNTGTYSANLIFNSLDTSVQINKPYNANFKYHNHFNEFFKQAPSSNVGLALSGAGDKMDYFISGSNNYQVSNLLNNGDYNRSNISMNLGFKLFKNFEVRSTSLFAYTKSTINDQGGNGTIYAAFNARPFADYFTTLPDGTYPAYLGDAQGVNGRNPNFLNEYTHNDDQKIDVMQIFSAKYTPVSWLDLDAKYGINYGTETQILKYDRQTENANVAATAHFSSNNGSSDQGELDNYQSSSSLRNFLGGATVRWGLFDFIKASSYGAFDYRNGIFKNYSSYGLNFPVYTPVTAQQTSEQHVASDFKTQFVTYGYVFDQKFDFGEFAGIGGGFRSDYSSAFGSGSQAFTFPHANGYLRLGELPFWKNSNISKTISEFKLRAAYGEAGLQPGPFQRYQTLNVSQVGGSSSFNLPSTLANPNLQVELSKELELGADIIFKIGTGNWFSSFTLQPSYWKRTTENAIGTFNQAPSSGIVSQLDNVLGFESHGFSVASRIQVADTKDFTWNAKILWGNQSSTVTKVAGGQIILTANAGSTGYVITPGTKVGQIFGYIGLQSVTQTDPSGNRLISDANAQYYEVASNGWVVDKRTKQPFYSTGKYPLGDPNPDFIMNFIQSLNYKGVSLDFQIDWVQGAHRYNQTKEWMYRDGIHSDYEVPITINGQTGAWSAFYRGEYAQRSRNGTKSYFYEDASFVRLRNVSIGFDLGRLLSVKGLKNVSVYASGRNLLTWTKYTGMDPEASSGSVYSYGSAWDRGTDHNTMPNLKQYTIGLKLGL